MRHSRSGCATVHRLRAIRKLERVGIGEAPLEMGSHAVRRHYIEAAAWQYDDTYSDSAHESKLSGVQCE